MIRIVRNLMLLGACALAMLSVAAAQTVPKFQVDPSWPQPLPGNWIIGTIGGITVDAQDHIWINQRPSSLDAREKRASTVHASTRPSAPVTSAATASAAAIAPTAASARRRQRTATPPRGGPDGARRRARRAAGRDGVPRGA